MQFDALVKDYALARVPSGLDPEDVAAWVEEQKALAPSDCEDFRLVEHEVFCENCGRSSVESWLYCSHPPGKLLKMLRELDYQTQTITDEWYEGYEG